MNWRINNSSKKKILKKIQDKKLFEKEKTAELKVNEWTVKFWSFCHSNSLNSKIKLHFLSNMMLSDNFISTTSPSELLFYLKSLYIT